MQIKGWYSCHVSHAPMPEVLGRESTVWPLEGCFMSWGFGFSDSNPEWLNLTLGLIKTFQAAQQASEGQDIVEGIEPREVSWDRVEPGQECLRPLSSSPLWEIEV